MEEQSFGYPETVYLIREKPDEVFHEDTGWDNSRHFTHDIEYVLSNRVKSSRLKISSLYEENDILIYKSGVLRQQLIQAMKLLEPFSRATWCGPKLLRYEDRQAVRSFLAASKRLLKRIDEGSETNDA